MSSWAIRCCLAFCAIAGLAPPLRAAEEVVRIPTRAGVTESVLIIHPRGAPVASALLFVGGPGRAGLKTPWPAGHRGGNFLFRSADRFVEDGLLVAVIDAPSDHASGLWDWRTGAEHAADIAAAIAALRAQAKAPVWVIGTSMGTLSAANAAARLKSGGPDGVVLTSSVTLSTKRSQETVGTVRLEDIAVPVLIVHHRHDGCRASPYVGAEALMDRLSGSRKRELMTFDGGDPPRSDACEAFAQHGYLGIEDKVVDAIAAWIKTAR